MVVDGFGSRFAETLALSAIPGRVRFGKTPDFINVLGLLSF